MLLLLLNQQSSGVSGSITATQDANTASLSGTVAVSGVSGSITATQANNTASLTGAETFSGSITATQAGNAASIAGAETFAGQITALQGANTASLSGSVSGGAISGAITATQDSQTAQLQGSGGITAAGGYDEPRKKRFIVEKNGKLLVYSTAKAAIGSLDEPEAKKEPEEQAETPQKEAVRTQEPQLQQEVDLAPVEEWARIAGLIEQYNAAYNSAQYEALIALFEQMQDEEEIEMLLLA